MVSESVQRERDHVMIAEWIHRRATLRRLEHTAQRPGTGKREREETLFSMGCLVTVDQTENKWEERRLGNLNQAPPPPLNIRS